MRKWFLTDLVSVDFKEINWLLAKVNQERVNSLFMLVQCASSLTDGILLFYSGINCQKASWHFILIFSLVHNLDFKWWQKLKLPKLLKFSLYFKTFLQNSWKVPTTIYIAICAAVRFLAANLFCSKSWKYVQTSKSVRQQMWTTNPTHFANVFE